MLQHGSIRVDPDPERAGRAAGSARGGATSLRELGVTQPLEELREANVEFGLWQPFDDGALRFVLTQALPVSDTIRDEMEENPAAELLLNLAPAVYDVGREFIGGERFFDMVKEHVEPAADRLRDEAAELGERASDVRG